MHCLSKALLPILLFCILIQVALAQSSGDTTMAAGPQYHRSALHKLLWGKNYRKEWSTPVKFPILNLDTVKGGLRPREAGGGNQSKSLKLENPAGERYKLRSVDKTLGKVLPESFLNTFIEDLVNDLVSMSFPYAATSLPIMQESAKIYRTNPKYVFVPKQPALDTFNLDFGDRLYVLEEHPSDDWSRSNSLGNFTNFYDTEEVMDSLLEDISIKVDQKEFLKARLFDILVGNWDRHEGQWKWGLRGNIFIPVPTDMDQVYFKYDGLLLSLAIAGSGMSYFQSFKEKMGDVTTFNYEQRGIDRVFLNELTKDDWIEVASSLKETLPDKVIEESVKGLPPEIYQISGDRIISALKARREQLLETAMTYYNFLAEEVEVTGTKENEQFEVQRLNDNVTSVKIYNLSGGSKSAHPSFSREFKTGETKQIRLFGIEGTDIFSVAGDVTNGIKLRLIGGPDKDVYTNSSSVANMANETEIYDNSSNQFDDFGKSKLRLSSDTSVHKYVYRSFLYDKAGIKPTIFYTNEDRLFVGLGYGVEHHAWRKLPFVYKQSIGVNYSISQKAFSLNYRGLFPKLVGKWDVPVSATYDFVRWNNYFGVGNETLNPGKSHDFTRLRTKEFRGDLGLKRTFGKSNFEIGGFFQTFSLINDADRIINNVLPTNPTVLQPRSYVGPQFRYRFVNLKDSIVPTSGFSFLAEASYSGDTRSTNKSYSTYSTSLIFFVPLSKDFSLAISSGVSTVAGNPEFYQLPTIGGGQTLRGYRLQRFRGKTAAYNSNELRYIKDVKSYIFNGKAGLVAFYDQGRVWQPSEISNTWHSGYGGGVLLAPFDKLLVNLTYGISKDDKLFHLRLTKLF